MGATLPMDYESLSQALVPYRIDCDVEDSRTAIQFRNRTNVL